MNRMKASIFHFDFLLSFMLLFWPCVLYFTFELHPLAYCLICTDDSFQNIFKYYSCHLWNELYSSCARVAFLFNILHMLCCWPANDVFIFYNTFFLLHGFQVEELVVRMVKWLKVGGFIFFRESCFHQSGDSKRKVNPTHYREPRFYTKVCFCKLLSPF